MRTVVWIAGASSGLGAAIADRCPWRGADVVDVSRSGGGPADAHVAADLSTRTGWDVLAADLDRRMAAGVDRAALIWSVGTTQPTGYVCDLDADAYAAAVVLNAAATPPCRSASAPPTPTTSRGSTSSSTSTPRGT